MTTEKKQLIVLLVVAAWVSVCFKASVEVDALPLEGLNTTVSNIWSALADSTPAVLFGGIFFWWFGRGSK
jgi:hypothetical protein